MFLPRKLLKDRNLNNGSKLLMYEILSLNELKLGCIAENYYFSELLGVSVPTINRYLKELKDNDYIKIKLKTRPSRRGQTRLVIPLGNLLQSESQIEHDIDIEMEKDKNPKEKDWFDEYMKNRLKQ